MTRNELAALLATLVARGTIPEAEAARIMALYDAGEFVPSDLPAPPRDGNEWMLALALVLLLTGGSARQRVSMARRRMARNRLRLGFETDVQRLARAVSEGRLAVPVWQRQMQSALAAYTRQMAIAGAGTLPTTATLLQVERQLAEQWPFLRRFGTELEARDAAGRPMSAAAVGSRSLLYQGVGWASYWRGEEQAQTSGQDGVGMTVYWDAVDDGGTCGPCLDAQNGSPYIPGRHPWPGSSVCQGLGRCRCQLRYVHDMDVWRQIAESTRAVA